jgi:hypothetical protein
MSTWIKSNRDIVVMKLEENGSLICFANGQIKHLSLEQELTLGNNRETLVERCPRR